MTTLSEKEMAKKYQEMVEKRRKYSRNHYNKMKKLAELGRQYQVELAKKK